MIPLQTVITTGTRLISYIVKLSVVVPAVRQLYQGGFQEKIKKRQQNRVDCERQSACGAGFSTPEASILTVSFICGKRTVFESERILWALSGSLLLLSCYVVNSDDFRCYYIIIVVIVVIIIVVVIIVVVIVVSSGLSFLILSSLSLVKRSANYTFVL